VTDIKRIVLFVLLFSVSAESETEQRERERERESSVPIVLRFVQIKPRLIVFVIALFTQAVWITIPTLGPLSLLKPKVEREGSGD